MEQKEIKINCPEGYEIDKEKSTFECIKFKPIEKELPKTWEEYCNNTKRKIGEAWLDDDSRICMIDIDTKGYFKRHNNDRNLLPSKEYAEAMLALCQLIQLRDCYNNSWVSDYKDAGSMKFTINVYKNEVCKNTNCHISHILAFKSEELRDQFLENFKDLIEIAKPLL